MVDTSGKVKVATGLTTQGQGHFTSFAQIAADELGVPIEDVEVVDRRHARFGYAVGTFASRAAVMSGNAIALASRKVRAKALRIAGDALEADPGDLEIVDGVVQVKGDARARRSRWRRSRCCPTRCGTPSTRRPRRPPSSPSATPAGRRSPRTRSPGSRAPTTTRRCRSTFANGMHAAVVENDPETAEIRVLRYCVVHDCGPLINPMIVEGQVHGGVAQGVGGALYERMVYDENGQLLNASFMDFLMPYASEIPHIEIDHLETPSPLNPLGIKGAGEAGVIPSAAVFAAAIEDAEGFPIDRMPISPTELFELRRRHAAGEIPSLHRRGHEGHRRQGRAPVKITGSATLQRAARGGLGRAQRPGGAGAHHPRLPAARGDRARTPTG